MKKIMIAMLLVMSTMAFSQNKNERVAFEVDGVCGMCKDRIEKACIKTKGVKSAVWNVKSHELKLIFDARKTNVETIKKSVVAVGHDVGELIATDEVYNNLDECCKYRDEQVVRDHIKQ